MDDLYRFPSESLHSFSFAQQSEELLQSRQNVLKRSIDFMRGRFGWAATNSPLVSTQARASGDATRSTIDLLSKASLARNDEAIAAATGPVTGPADVDKNVFEKAFMDRVLRTPEQHEKETSPKSSGQSSPQQQKRELRSAPGSRRVSLKRAFTDLGSASLQNKLAETLESPDATADPYSLTDPSASELGFSAPTLHTHSSKWTPVAQAVFRTEAKPPFAIFAANDLSCLVFGFSQREIRSLSILDIVHEDRRDWLESRLLNPSADTVPKHHAPLDVKSRTEAVDERTMERPLSKPPWLEATRARSRMGDKIDLYSGSSGGNNNNSNINKNNEARARQANHHLANKSRGVLLCGDVVPINKRNGTRGSASIWILEKRGGLIWVIEEVAEDVACLEFNERFDVISARGDVDKIWGPTGVQPGLPLTQLLPHIPAEFFKEATESGLAKIADLRYFAARTPTNIFIPATVELEKPRSLRVISFPQIAGMMTVSPSTLQIISANNVFSLALFGRERLEKHHITDLVPEFDKLLNVLTEEDRFSLTEGTAVPELSFRRARMLLMLREDKDRAASIFAEPPGIRAVHRDGSTLAVDVQLRVVKSGTIFSENSNRTTGDESSGNNDDDDDAVSSSAVTPEAVYALWITYSRTVHSSKPGVTTRPEPLRTATSSTKSHDEPPPPSSLEQTQEVERTRTSSNLRQQLQEAASEPLDDGHTAVEAKTKKAAATADHSNRGSSGEKQRQQQQQQQQQQQPHKRTIDDYTILEDMGQGAYGQVKLACLKENPNKKMVLKYVTKSRILVDTWTRDRRLGTVPLEIHVMDYLRRDGLRHPNIVQMEGFFEDEINYYIEMTPHGLPGMDLFDYIELKANMDENECRAIFRQVVNAIHHLHNKALVVHRDIKDENLILDSEGTIKLIDFGSAAYIKNGPFDVFVGTIGEDILSFSFFLTMVLTNMKCTSTDYAAPEVLQGKSYRGKEQDIWALGILLYTMIYKENPFYNVDEILDHPLRIPFLPFSEDCLDLIRRMLDRDVDNRVTISEVKDHPWITAN